MQNSFSIRSLDNEADARIIAKWFYDFWKKVPPYLSVEQEYLSLMQSIQNPVTRLPVSLVCYGGGQPLGIICSGKDEMFTGRSDLTPWVTSTFVIEEKRHFGIASALLRELHSLLKSLGFENVYVTTREAAKLYQRNGYEYIESAQKDSTKYDILKYTLR